jgi:hypothetical protein
MADRSAPAASADSLLASSGPKIFISYRTYEHAEYVEPLAATLSSSGFTVLLDRQKNLEDYRFGNLDLPLSGGLALGLREPPTSRSFSCRARRGRRAVDRSLA